MDRQQSSEGRGPSTPVVPLNELVADLVSSNTLPPAPPRRPTLYDRLNGRYREIRNTRRQITRDLRHVIGQIEGYQHVPVGRYLSLVAQLGEYSRRQVQLAQRRALVLDYMERNPRIHSDDMIDSSDDEELVFGRDSSPFLDQGSDSDGSEEVRFHVTQEHDEQTITLLTRDVEAYLMDPDRHRRTRRGEQAGTNVQGPMHILGQPSSGYREAAGEFNTVVVQPLIARVSANIDRVSNLLDDDGGYTGDSEDEEEGEEDDDDDEDDDDEDNSSLAESDYQPTPPEVHQNPTSRDGESVRFEGNEHSSCGHTAQQTQPQLDVDLERPQNWQRFHQYFMYSRRGDVTEVTNELQDTFHFEPVISKAWVGRQLNKAENIREQTEFLEAYLPGETGTLDRAEARLQMGLSGFFIQDTYDGKSAGQIFDIDPASDAYTKPIRPADLPPTWTPSLDAILLTVLPEISLMEGFWIENAALLQEMYEDGVGSSRKEHALSLRCGQLSYLRLSEDQLAAGRQREQSRLAALSYGNHTQIPEFRNVEQASASV